MAKQRHGKVRVYLPGMVNEKGEQIYRNVPAALWNMSDTLQNGEEGYFQKRGYKLADKPAPAPVEAKPAKEKKVAKVEVENAENEAEG